MFSFLCSSIYILCFYFYPSKAFLCAKILRTPKWKSYEKAMHTLAYQALQQVHWEMYGKTAPFKIQNGRHDLQEYLTRSGGRQWFQWKEVQVGSLRMKTKAHPPRMANTEGKPQVPSSAGHMPSAWGTRASGTCVGEEGVEFHAPHANINTVLLPNLSFSEFMPPI